MTSNMKMMGPVPFGMDMDEGPIWVSDFDTDAAKAFCNALFKASEEDPSKPIVVYINSGGGEVSGLFAMMTAMDTVPNKIVTVAMGYAMSAGALLLAHGSIRCVSPHARVMVHKVQAGAFGSMDDILNETEEVVRVNDYVMGLLAKDCKRSKAEIEKALSGSKREVYLDADGAVKFGLADIIGVPRIQGPGAVDAQWTVAVHSPADSTPTPPAKPVKTKKKAKK